MKKSLYDKVNLHNGVEMPQFGLGVYKVEEGKEVCDTVTSALEIGYRLIDTAALYKNEEGVGKAIRKSSVPREELFITTKVWNSDQGYESTLKAFEDSMGKLALEYVDLYLIHWPVKEKYHDTWRALEKLYLDGRVKAIGVSNFQIHHLEDLMKQSEIKPMVNQVELHPLLSQVELRSFCSEQQIQIEAWSPIARGRILDNLTLNELATKYEKSSAQIILRWHLQNDVIIIPKSVTPSRLVENANIFDFELNPKEMEAINRLNVNQRFGADPDDFDF
ncbi:aldo/keto reductase [Cytobacillus spongiae]|uniref:aldo/keto reductase n=1 Tax=Cytobacillus spongiae TaxID=2901381 RepID=UPI001F3B940E|nr:aldo/keto reductase [Cytobacillus spongiae]UII56758.1 aldo/keto reductase [Cytobacillus spongiae]